MKKKIVKKVQPKVKPKIRARLKNKPIKKPTPKPKIRARLKNKPIEEPKTPKQKAWDKFQADFKKKRAGRLKKYKGKGWGKKTVTWLKEFAQGFGKKALGAVKQIPVAKAAALGVTGGLAYMANKGNNKKKEGLKIESKAKDKTPKTVSTNSKTTPKNNGGYRVAKTKEERSDFRKSFAAARKAGKKTFIWQGRPYTTRLKK